MLGKKYVLIMKSDVLLTFQNT